MITIIGKKESVDAAKAELETVIKDIANTTESTMSVDPKHHRHFVTRRGEVLHRISDECGGVLISFPRASETGDRVTLKGAKECIEVAKARIQEIVADLVCCLNCTSQKILVYYALSHCCISFL